MNLPLTITICLKTNPKSKFRVPNTFNCLSDPSLYCGLPDVDDYVMQHNWIKDFVYEMNDKVWKQTQWKSYVWIAVANVWEHVNKS